MTSRAFCILVLLGLLLTSGGGGNPVAGQPAETGAEDSPMTMDADDDVPDPGMAGRAAIEPPETGAEDQPVSPTRAATTILRKTEADHKPAGGGRTASNPAADHARLPQFVYFGLTAKDMMGTSPAAVRNRGLIASLTTVPFGRTGWVVDNPGLFRGEGAFPHLYKHASINGENRLRDRAHAEDRGKAWAATIKSGQAEKIVIDELNASFSMRYTDPPNATSALALLGFALDKFTAILGPTESRDRVIVMLSPNLTMTTQTHNYRTLAKFLKTRPEVQFVGLETYLSHQCYLTGREPNMRAGRPPVNRKQMGEAYVNARLVHPVLRWRAQTGDKVLVFLAVSRWAAATDTRKHPFAEFLRVQFRALLRPGVKPLLKNGIGAFKWDPGSGWWEITHDQFERAGVFRRLLEHCRP